MTTLSTFSLLVAQLPQEGVRRLVSASQNSVNRPPAITPSVISAIYASDEANELLDTPFTAWEGADPAEDIAFEHTRYVTALPVATTWALRELTGSTLSRGATGDAALPVRDASTGRAGTWRCEGIAPITPHASGAAGNAATDRNCAGPSDEDGGGATRLPVAAPSYGTATCATGTTGAAACTLLRTVSFLHPSTSQWLMPRTLDFDASDNGGDALLVDDPGLDLVALAHDVCGSGGGGGVASVDDVVGVACGSDARRRAAIAAVSSSGRGSSREGERVAPWEDTGAAAAASAAAANALSMAAAARRRQRQEGPPTAALALEPCASGMTGGSSFTSTMDLLVQQLSAGMDGGGPSGGVHAAVISRTIRCAPRRARSSLHHGQSQGHGHGQRQEQQHQQLAAVATEPAGLCTRAGVEGAPEPEPKQQPQQQPRKQAQYQQLHSLQRRSGRPGIEGLPDGLSTCSTRAPAPVPTAANSCAAVKHPPPYQACPGLLPLRLQGDLPTALLRAAPEVQCLGTLAGGKLSALLSVVSQSPADCEAASVCQAPTFSAHEVVTTSAVAGVAVCCGSARMSRCAARDADLLQRAVAQGSAIAAFAALGVDLEDVVEEEWEGWL
ncbi:hypothetical protein HYH02_012646 [Chlamydomonas schloesseri]|uniref:Uncharacterized protein n=1 Tax=Chlamydomonas schloesseri TaxID=2026947 RepID=A0A835W1A2_9CHLO|nr:hypothetical protein HYH02_012646 [Chlamydomonas schloesseri]|eukprot:KAG2433528.1 hypothetical protein HYH02_012646 [Chlamydomonas schloesseri]